jgi:hypothetical protein
MKTRKNRLLVAFIGLTLLLLIGSLSVLAGNGNDYEESIQWASGLEWSAAGTWVITVPTPMGNITLLHMLYPQDLTGTRYGGIMKQINENPTFFGTFPEAEGGSDVWASQTVRTGPANFETTLLYYTNKKGEGPVAETVTIYIMNATWRLTGPDTIEGECTLAIYLAEQDANGDGFPDEGQEPAVCTPFTYTAKRLNVMPGCVPPPEPEPSP